MGVENRKQIILLAVLGVFALVLIGRIVFDSGPPIPPASAPNPMEALAPSRPAPRARSKGKRVAVAPHSIDPSLRYDWLKASEDTKYEGNGRNIFMVQAEIPQPLKNPALEAEKAAAQGPPLPPPPPPITLKFYGFASKPGEPKRVFLSQGEDLFIASEGEIVDRRYKVLHILPMSVEIEDVLNNNRQSIPLTQG
jgi:hypothetical protein